MKKMKKMKNMNKKIKEMISDTNLKKNFDDIKKSFGQKIDKIDTNNKKDSYENFNKDYFDLINSLDKFTENNDDYDSNKNPDDFTPHQAQKETFRLINTVNQLNKTITNLAPTIKQGRELLNMFDKLKL